MRSRGGRLRAAPVPRRSGIVPRPRMEHIAGRYLGKERATGYLTQVDQPGTRMARIAVRRAWVGVLEFETRLPGVTVS